MKIQYDWGVWIPQILSKEEIIETQKPIEKNLARIPEPDCEACQ